MTDIALAPVPGARRETVPAAGDLGSRPGWSWADCTDNAAASITEVFGRQAAAHPERTAVACQGQALTYRELDERSGALARALLEQGARPGALVGVRLEPSAEMIVTLLAVMKAGAAYVPLDPGYPPQRQAVIIEDAVPAVVVVSDDAATGPDSSGIRLISCQARPRDPGTALPYVPPDAAAYVIHTSGSTGRPKGVVIPHRNVLALLAATAGPGGFDLGPQDSWSFFHSFAFDFSVWEIWGCLLTGGRLVVVPRWMAVDPREFHALLAAEKVTILNQTPSAFSQLVAAESFAAGGLAVRLLIFGGEPLDAAVLLPWMDLYRDDECRVVNMYGITETTVHCTQRTLTRADAERGTRSIGQAIPGWRVYVLDEHGRQAALGDPGEIYVGGPGVARGYLNRPELTRERFVPDRISGLPGERMYRSGDAGRLCAGGEIEHLGRLDDQVKIRGHRIELGEIRTVLAGHPAVDAAAVLVRDPGDPSMARIDAYVVAGEDTDTAHIRHWLVERLPDYLVPATVTRVPKLPLTPHGKLDSARLPDPFAGRESSGSWQGPRGVVEEVLCGLFAEVLGVAAVSADEGFFDLGGHSLSAARLVVQVRAVLGAEIGIRDLFEASTVRALAARVGSGGARREALVAAERPVPVPVSFAQGRLWLIDQFDGPGPLYNVPLVFELTGPVDDGVLAAALDDVVARHESLRTVFGEAGGEPVQCVLGAAQAARGVSVLPVTPDQVPGVLREAVRHVFDLAGEPPVRAWLLRTGPEHAVLVLVVHHIACDGLSMGALLRDLSAAYAARLKDGVPGWGPLPVQYADYALWQRRVLGSPDDPGSVLSGQLEFWRQALRELPAELDLPRDRPRPAVPGSGGAVCGLQVGPDLRRRVEEVARQCRATLFMAMQAAIAVLLCRLGAGTDIPLGTVVAGRPDPALDDLVGFFVNTVVLRTDVSGQPTFRDLLDRVRETDLSAFANSDVPFEYVVEAVAPPRVAGRNPLFQVAVALDTGQPDALRLPGAGVRELPPPDGVAKFDLTFYLIPAPDASLTIRIEYATDLYDPATITALATRLHTLLDTLTTNPDTPVTALDVLTGAERSQIMHAWNQTAVCLPDATISALFEAQAERAPDAVALVHGPDKLTYAQLNAHANRLARELADRGVGPEGRVALVLPRGQDLFTAMLAVNKAGGVFVPIDPAYPSGRIATMMADAEPACIVTTSDSPAADELRFSAPLLLDDAETRRRIAASSTANLTGPQRPAEPRTDNAAYLIYTSGSTGQPKGVLVTHRGIASMVHAQSTVLGIMPGSAMLQFSSSGFDAMIFEFCMALLTGARLVLAPGESRLPGEDLIRLVAQQRVTHAILTPTVVAAIEEDTVPSLRTLVVGGEACPAELVDRWAPGRAMFNAYGPTEITVFATLSQALEAGGPATIGGPISNTQVYVLDACLRPVPAGVAGELYIAGAGLARGYLNRTAETASRFVANPFGRAGSRMYRTGDRVRWDGTGNLHFLGRSDDQLKLRGVRIEPGEIESALARMEGVGAAVVVVREDRPGAKQLVAYIVPAEGAAPDPVVLRRELTGTLPAHMVPAAIVPLAAFPLTTSGKLDRRAMPPPGRESSGSWQGPRGVVEEVLCGLFAEVLGVAAVSADEGFFDLGGHSLSAARLVVQVRAVLGAEIGIRDLFEASTVRALAARVGSGGARREALVAAERPVPVPVSFAQGRLWLIDQFDGPGPLYNVPLVFELTGPVDDGVLAAALDDVVARHESLRTVFGEAGGEPVQCVLGAAQAARGVSVLPVTPDQVPGVLREAVRHVFDLAGEPPVRAWLLRTGPEHAVLVLVVHHIACDGLSMGALLRDLSAAYAARLKDGVPGWGPLPVQYADYALWQRRVLGSPDDPGSVLSGQLEFWRQALRELPAELDLPRDRPRPAVPGSGGAVCGLQVGPDLRRRVEEVARQCRATLFMAMQAAIAVLLCRLGAGTDIPLGTVVAGRPDPALDDLVGFFVNTVVLRTDVSGQPTFRDLLDRVRETDLSAFANSDVPFEYVVEAVAPPRVAGRNPLFQVAVALDTGQPDALRLPGAGVRELPPPDGVAKFDLTFYLIPAPDASLTIRIEYATDLYDPATITALATRLHTLLDTLTTNPDTPVTEASPRCA